MNSARRTAAAIAAVIVAIASAAPACAADADLDRFRAAIDAFVGRLATSSNGMLRWAGSDPYEIRRDGGALVAVIANARLSFQTGQGDRLILDRVEIRQIGQKDDGKLAEFALELPNEMTINEADGTETKITLQDAKADTVIETHSGRGRETAIAIASARIDQPTTGAWVTVGPLSMTSKLAAEPNGGWSGPVEFEVTGIECFAPQGPLSGKVDRIAFSGKSAGPKLEQLNRLRDALDSLQTEDVGPPEARTAAFLALLPSMTAPFGSMRGEFSVDGLTVRNLTGEALVSLAQAASTIEIAGLDSEAAAARFTIRHRGLDLAPSLLDEAKVPHHFVLDVGIGDMSTEALGQLFRAASTMASDNAAGEVKDQPKEQAVQQALSAAAKLNPTFRIYDLAIDTRDIGVDLRAEATGSPLAPKGYSAAADLLVRGFDAIPQWGAGIPLAEYLPVLKELGIEQNAADGAPRLAFHMMSTPSHQLTVNGNDVGVWFGREEAKAGQSRLLKPADPPLQGEDVRNAQRALIAANIAVAEDGVYGGSTAAAVARFQKQTGIGVTGVVDAATRQRLGLPTVVPRRGSRN